MRRLWIHFSQFISYSVLAFLRPVYVSRLRSTLEQLNLLGLVVGSYLKLLYRHPCCNLSAAASPYTSLHLLKGNSFSLQASQLFSSFFTLTAFSLPVSMVSGLGSCIVLYCCMTHFLKIDQLKITDVSYVKNKLGILEQLLWVAWPWSLMRCRRCGEVKDWGGHWKAEWTKDSLPRWLTHIVVGQRPQFLPVWTPAWICLSVFRTTLCGIQRGRKAEARMSFMGCGKDQGREHRTSHSTVPGA